MVQLVNSINTSSAQGPDRWHTYKSSQGIHVLSICKPPTELFSLSLNQGKLPDWWKFANMSTMF